MKNTTFRKKALLSSVAMLLVAFIALGSATFAWFTANPTVEANGLTAEATTSAGLSILSESERAYYAAQGADEVWDYDTIINCKPDALVSGAAKVFSTPMSHDFAIKQGEPAFYTAKAVSEYGYAAQDAEKGIDYIAQASTASDYYFEQINFKSTVANADVTVNSVSVSLTAGADAAMAGAVRAMLLDDQKNVIGIWTIGGTSNKYITSNEGVKSLSTGNFTAVNSGSKVAVSLAANSGAENKVYLYVWLDGESAACYTKGVNLDTTILSNIKVELSTTEVPTEAP